MPRTKPQTEQVKNISAETELGTAANAGLDTIIDSVSQTSRTPLRLFASATADALLNIAASQVQIGNLAGRSVGPIGTVTPSFAASTINFQTGATTGGTISATFPSTTVGQFRRAAFTLMSTGTMNVSFSAQAASVGALADPGTLYTVGGQPVGWVDLEATASTAFKTAGSATSIIENAVSGTSRVVNIFGSGGSSSSGGSAPGSTAVIADNQVAAATLVTTAAPNNSGEYFYSIARGTNRETGRVLWSHNGTILSRTFYGDGGVGDTGVTLDVVLSGANVLLQYTSTSTGSSGTLTYSATAWT